MEPESKSFDSMKNLYANGYAARGFKAAAATVDHVADTNANRFPAQLPITATTLNTVVDSFAKLPEPTQNNQIEQAPSVQTPNAPSSLYGIYRTGLTPFKRQPAVTTSQMVVDSKPVVPSVYYNDNNANSTSTNGETVNDTNSDDAYLNRTSPKSIQVELNYKDESVLLEELTKRINDEPATVIPSSDTAASTSSDTTDNAFYRTSTDPVANQDNIAVTSVNQSSSATITTAQPSSLLDILNKNRYNWKELLNQHLTLNGGGKKIVTTTSSPPTSTRSEVDPSKFAELNRYAFPGNFHPPPFSPGTIPTKYPSAAGATSAFTPMNFPIFYPTLQVPNTLTNVSGPYNRLLMGTDASPQQEPITENPFFTKPVLPVFIPSAFLPYYALLPPFSPAFINDNNRCNDKQGPKRGIDFSQSLRSPLPPPPPYKPELAFVLMPLPQSSLSKRKV